MKIDIMKIDIMKIDIMKIYDTDRIIMIHFLITHINTLCSNIEHN